MDKKIISTKEDRQWQGIPGIEVASNGRLWAVVYSGGPKEPHVDNHILIMTSFDGNTWEKPQVIVEQDAVTRVFDPTLWHDPSGRLWLIYNRASIEKRDYSVWAITTKESTLADPKWSEPRKLEFNVPLAFRMNKPIVNTDGEWLLPVTWSDIKPKGWWANPLDYQGVAISKDNGVSWELHGKVKARPWALENMIVEVSGQKFRYWMLIRSGASRLYQSYSHDGREWTRGKKSAIRNCRSRFYVRRLQSGRILLINNTHPKKRIGMYAALSEDEGKTFPYRLTLDTREKVSYPDCVQGSTGKLHIVFDRERKKVGEINYICIEESEILHTRGHKTLKIF